MASHDAYRKRSFVMKLDKTHVTIILYTLNAHLINGIIIRNKCNMYHGCMILVTLPKK